MTKFFMLAGILAAGVLVGTGDARADIINLDAVAGIGGWVAIAPPGASDNSGINPLPIATDLRISTFEAANVGFNSDANYDASAWSAYSGSWIDAGGINPFFARTVVNIAGTPTAGSFTMLVDDDSQLWVNGTLVLDDESLGTGSAQTADITPYLVSGQNVIAFLADNSYGGGYAVYRADGSITFTPSDTDAPEPASFLLAGLGMIGAVIVARRRARV